MKQKKKGVMNTHTHTHTVTEKKKFVFELVRAKMKKSERIIEH